MNDAPEPDWDAFISHASEDKESFVEPLANELQRWGLRVWFDKFTLRVGSSLRESIDLGLSKSRFGIVVLSHSFFSKNWPPKELNGLFARQANGNDIILPVWHGITKDDLLEYSPLLADIIALNSSAGVAEIARSLVGTIKPNVFEVEASRSDAKNAVGRIRERVRDSNPNLDCRVTFGPMDASSLGADGIRVPPDVIFTGSGDGTRIEVVATDREAYNKSPHTFTVKMTQRALEKIEEFQKTGKPVELGPDEILELNSSLIDLLTPSGVSGERRLILGPQNTPNSRLRFKLVFTLGTESEEFPCVEFETLRRGTEEHVIHSIAPAMTLELTLDVSLVTKRVGFRAEYSFPGHEIRDVYKSHHALSLMLRGGSMEMRDPESDRTLGAVGGARPSARNGLDDELEGVVLALHDVALALNETIMWPTAALQDDFKRLVILQQVVRGAEVSLDVGSVGMVVVGQRQQVEEILQQPVIAVRQLDPPEFARVFGRTFGLGPYTATVKPQESQITPVEDDPTSWNVSITLAEPLQLTFDRFKKTDFPSQQESSQRGA
jgi:hypothetical protein